MRPVTRKVTLAIVGALLVLLALGAVPSLLRAGDPYHVVATPDGDGPALDVSTLSDRRFPFVTAALGNATTGSEGRSGPYWRGPTGFKEAFTHSPFDELDALAARQPNATANGAVRVVVSGERYRLEIVREAGE